MTTGNRRSQFISWLCKLTRLNYENKWSIIFTQKNSFLGLNFSFSQESTSRKYFSLADWADSRENNSRSMCLWCEASRKHTALLFFSLIIPFLFGGLKEKCQLPRHFLCIYACLLIPINQTHIAATIFLAHFTPADTSWSGYIKALILVNTFVLVLPAFKIPSMQMSTK